MRETETAELAINSRIYLIINWPKFLATATKDATAPAKNNITAGAKGESRARSRRSGRWGKGTRAGSLFILRFEGELP